MLPNPILLVYKSTRLEQQFDWPRLRSLTLRLWSSESEQITSGITFLKDFQHLTRTLKEVTVEVYEKAVVPVAKNLARHADLCSELDHTLLEFSHPLLVWNMAGPFISGTSFWIEELGKLFPVLFQRGALTVAPNKGKFESFFKLKITNTFPDFSPGHAESIVALAISPDNNWAASGSRDNTIILWDITSGVIAHQWIYNNLDGCTLNQLAFSPNSRYLLSSAMHTNDHRPVIWDLGGDLHQVLEGHTDEVESCAWSPRGDVIASGSQDGTVRLWDANTFQPLHVLKHAAESEVQLVQFSPDGRWLLTGCIPGSYYLWDVASGTGRQLRESIIGSRLISIAASCSPTSTRFAIASPGGMVEILETDGEEWGYVILGNGVRKLGWETRHIGFSPDGNLVLTVPSYNAPTKTMKIWDAYTGAELLSLKGHDDVVLTACFSPCGKYIASGSPDHTVRLWRTSDGSCITTLSEHKGSARYVAFSPDGKTLVSGDLVGIVIIRQMRNILPIYEQDQ